MNISGLPKRLVLFALYSKSRAIGLGILQAERCVTTKYFQEMLDLGQTYFDYVFGRVMKIDISTDEINTRLYNRDNGENAAEEIINELRKFFKKGEL